MLSIEAEVGPKTTDPDSRPQSSSRNARGGRREQGAKQGVSFRALSSTLLLIGQK